MAWDRRSTVVPSSKRPDVPATCWESAWRSAVVLGTSVVAEVPGQADTTLLVQGTRRAVAQVLSVSPALPQVRTWALRTRSLHRRIPRHRDGQAQAQIITSALLGDFKVSLPGTGILAESSGSTSTQSTTLAGANGEEGAAHLNASAAAKHGHRHVKAGQLQSAERGDGRSRGPRAAATTSIVNGQTRQAVATSSIGSVSLLGGLVSLNGLQWTATQSTGAQSVQKGTFGISSISLAGKTVSIPVGGLNGAITLINAGLAKTGLRLGLPTQGHRLGWFQSRKPR